MNISDIVRDVNSGAYAHRSVIHTNFQLKMIEKGGCLLEYVEFLEQVKLTVQEKAGRETKISVSRLMKNNREDAASMMIQQTEGNIAPVIDLAPYYEKYQTGKTLEEIADEILEVYKQKKTCGSIDLSFYTDYEKVRECISCKLVNFERNRYLLERVPHQRFLDLAIVYHCPVEDELIGKGNILIQNAHLELWDADLEEIHDAAISNTIHFHPYELIEISDMLAELLGNFPEEEEPLFPMYVLTNTERCYGAVNLILNPVLEAIAEKLDSDFFVLPSSIHECMIVPAAEDIRPEELHQMVHDINQEHVALEEILGESVYRYQRQDRHLLIAWEANSL